MEPISLQPARSKKLLVIIAFVILTFFIGGLVVFMRSDSKPVAKSSTWLLFTLEKSSKNDAFKLLETKEIKNARQNQQGEGELYFLTVISGGQEVHKSTFTVPTVTSEYLDPKTGKFKTISSSASKSTEIMTPYYGAGSKLVITNADHDVVLKQTIEKIQELSSK